ncbi:MAG: CinA family nicotinamide mononucleotide deamidase-related protein [Spirochaetes bacterium]|jgi:nicotinamide-nucleotide amidase|nr:CinA family nicotinamide mononucleotide deamidase-related protein [Spirochaetota bacterium]
MILRIGILSTGDELIRGTVTDANAAYLSSRLSGSNFSVVFHHVCGDSMDGLSGTIDSLIRTVDVLIVTGGLGPTDDDNTVEAVCGLFGLRRVIHGPAMRKYSNFLEGLRLEKGGIDEKMAEIPDKCLVMENLSGLAPGFIVENGRKSIICMPGVPGEMKEMFEKSAFPYLKSKYPFIETERLLIRIAGSRESEINEIIRKFGITMEDYTIGITTVFGTTSVTFIQKEGRLFDREKIKKSSELLFSESMLMEEYYFPEEELLGLLLERGETLSVAESCTGGLISKRITDIPGSSASFIGGIVAYSNDIKTGFLGVPHELIDRFGAVSEEVAAAMAEGVRNGYAADFGVSTTGIAGPGGGNENKPVGTVCFGFSKDSETMTLTRNFSGDREMIRNISSLFAIEYLRRYLRKSRS